jgi:hypothetical protein
MLDRYVLIRAMRRILGAPKRKFSIVGLAKEAGAAPSAAKYSLDYMMERGLVTKEVVGRSHLYQADTGSFLARSWKRTFSLNEIQKSGFLEHVLGRVRHISSIVVYGSVAQGTDDEGSDIDMIIIADTKDTKAIFDAPAIGGRELNVQAYTPMEWKRKAQKDKPFYEDVILNCIPLHGERPVVL